MLRDGQLWGQKEKNLSLLFLFILCAKTEVIYMPNIPSYDWAYELFLSSKLQEIMIWFPLQALKPQKLVLTFISTIAVRAQSSYFEGGIINTKISGH